MALNITDFGVVRGITSSQTAAIKTALDANPGRTFHFPAGDYRLDTGLVINNANSIILDKDARLYAGAPMNTLVTYAYTGPGYAEDKALSGGTLDGNLNASKILTIQTVLHFTLAHTVFKNGINRGLVTVAGPGAEVFAYDLRFFNTGTTNVADNIAIEANMGDGHFRDIVIRDWTTGVKDTASNRWNRVHPWISPDGAVTQMTARYPTSIGFDITGPSDLVEVYSDTYRTAYKIRASGAYTPVPLLNNCSASWASAALSTTLANAYPGYAIDNLDGVGVVCDRMTLTGHSAASAQIAFVNGPAANVTARNTYSYGFMAGELEYLGGIAQGLSPFTPTFYGTTASGTHTYLVQVGEMVVDKDSVRYSFHIKATLDASGGFAGNLRIGGLPLPTGSTNIRDGSGPAGMVFGAHVSTCVIFSGTAATIVPFGLSGSNVAEIDVAALRGKVIEILASVTATHYRADTINAGQPIPMTP